MEPVSQWMGIDNDFTGLQCRGCGRVNRSLHPGGELASIPTGASSAFHVSVQKGTWPIACSHCLSSSQLYIAMDFPGFSLGDEPELLLSLSSSAMPSSSSH